MTFDELFKEHRLTPEEREELIFYLGMLRMTKTVRSLIPSTRPRSIG